MFIVKNKKMYPPPERTDRAADTPIFLKLPQQWKLPKTKYIFGLPFQEFSSRCLIARP